MDDRVTGREEAAAPATGPRLNIALWVLQVLLAVSFASAAFQKLGGSDYMVKLFDKIGFGTWFRYVIGLIELVGAIGLLIPLLTGAAAVGLMLLMVGATITNVSIGENPASPIVFLLFTVLLVWGRWPQFEALVLRLRN